MEGFDINYMIDLLPILGSYLFVTLKMTFWGFVVALILSIFLALVRVFNISGINAFTVVFISFFRGTPLLVQLFLLYYGLPQIFPIFTGLDAFTAAVIGLSLHFSAYMAESLRGAISGIDRSQMEASLSIGMTRFQAMKRVILPQATRIAIPSLVNYFIDMLKSSSLAFTLGVTEIMAVAQMEASSSFKFFEAFMAVALIYWILVVIFTRIQALIEVKFNRAYHRLI